MERSPWILPLIDFLCFQARSSADNRERSGMTATTIQSNKPSKRSPAWMYFQRITVDDRLKAKCLIDGCTTTLSTPFHSTSTLIRHLRDVHKMEDFQSKEILPNHSTKKRISSHLKKRLDDAVLVAIVEDGRSFNDFSKRGLKKFIQAALPSKRTISSPLNFYSRLFVI